jgi:type II secretory pathway pseudopilin PulG
VSDPGAESAGALGGSGGPPEPLLAAVGLVLLLTVAFIPFLMFRRTRRWAAIIFAVLLLLQLVVLNSQAVLDSYSEMVPLLLACLGAAALQSPLLLWRRTRRLGLVLVGSSAIAGMALGNYYAQVICTIGYVLLLLALWPRWRLVQPAPAGREKVPAIPSRGVLTARTWPACRRPEADGFTLVASLVGLTCLLITVAVATQMIATTIAAVRRADHATVAMEALESARERSLLGLALGDLDASAARLLPDGRATVVRAPAEPGVTRITATATWREPDGRPSRVTLEWLMAEGVR